MDHIREYAWIFAWILVLILLPIAFAFPMPPFQVYGKVMINQTPAALGTNITATDQEGNICGSAQVSAGGDYILSCVSDNPSTSLDEGGTEHDLIMILVNNKDYGYEVRWRAGGFTNIDIYDTHNIKRSKDESVEPASPHVFPEDYFVLAIFFAALIIYLIVRSKMMRGPIKR